MKEKLIYVNKTNFYKKFTLEILASPSIIVPKYFRMFRSLSLLIFFGFPLFLNQKKLALQIYGQEKWEERLKQVEKRE